MQGILTNRWSRFGCRHGSCLRKNTCRPARLTACSVKLLNYALDCLNWIIELSTEFNRRIHDSLNFLIEEHQYIAELSSKIQAKSIIYPNIETTVLENNIFGVDLNEESVDRQERRIRRHRDDPFFHDVFSDRHNTLLDGLLLKPAHAPIFRRQSLFILLCDIRIHHFVHPWILTRAG